MIWAIIIVYWLPIILGLLSIKLIKFNMYDRHNEKIKFPIIAYILGIISLFIPIIGFIAAAGTILFIAESVKEDGCKIDHWLFKQI